MLPSLSMPMPGNWFISAANEALGGRRRAALLKISVSFFIVIMRERAVTLSSSSSLADGFIPMFIVTEERSAVRLTLRTKGAKPIILTITIYCPATLALSVKFPFSSVAAMATRTESVPSSCTLTCGKGSLVSLSVIRPLT